MRGGAACGAVMLLCAAPAHVALAQSPQPANAVPYQRYGLVVEGAAEFGGDEVARVYFDDNSTQSVRAGQGLSAGVGFYVRPEQDVSIRTTIGFKYVTTKASNADIHLSRVPINLIASYHFDNGVRLGGGGIWQTGIKFHGGGLGPNVDFDNSLGYTLEVGWRWIVASYTGMDYKDEFGGKYKADSYGIRLIGEF